MPVRRELRIPSSHLRKGSRWASRITTHRLQCSPNDTLTTSQNLTAGFYPPPVVTPQVIPYSRPFLTPDLVDAIRIGLSQAVSQHPANARTIHERTLVERSFILNLAASIRSEDLRTIRQELSCGPRIRERILVRCEDFRGSDSMETFVGDHANHQPFRSSEKS